VSSQYVIALQIFFAYDTDLCLPQLNQIKRALGSGKIWPAMHDKRHIALIIISHETPTALVDRLRPVLEVDAISNYWAQVPTANIAGKFGNLDSFVSQVRLAYGLMYERSKPKHVITPQAYARKDRRQNALGKVPVEGSGDRQKTKNPYQRERRGH
jgi:hypothetical protein